MVCNRLTWISELEFSVALEASDTAVQQMIGKWINATRSQTQVLLQPRWVRYASAAVGEEKQCVELCYSVRWKRIKGDKYLLKFVFLWHGFAQSLTKFVHLWNWKAVATGSVSENKITICWISFFLWFFRGTEITNHLYTVALGSWTHNP